MTRNRFAQQLQEKMFRIERWEHYREIPEEDGMVEELK